MPDELGSGYDPTGDPVHTPKLESEEPKNIEADGDAAEGSVEQFPQRPWLEESRKRAAEGIVKIRTAIEEARQKFAEQGTTPEQLENSTVGQIFDIVSKWLRVRELALQKIGPDEATARGQLSRFRVGNASNDPDPKGDLLLNFGSQFIITFNPSRNEIGLSGAHNGGDDGLMYATEEYTEGGGTSDEFTMDTLDPEMNNDQAKQLREVLNIVNEYLTQAASYLEGYDFARNDISRSILARENFPSRRLAKARGALDFSNYRSLPEV